MAPTPEIVQCLAASLSSDPNARITAELRLSELLALPEAGLALSQLVLAQDIDMALRQMSRTRFSFSACIVLRKYVTERWSPYFQSFRGSAPPVEVKAQIRQAVFQGLSDPHRKIRSSCAHTLSTIANSDWPDEYPDLLTSLINLLGSNSPESVHGAMQVLSEFIQADLTEDQLLPVLRQLLPALLSILGSNETHTPLTRARTVAVFRQCLTALYMVKDQHPQAVREATASVVPVWLEAFAVLLNIDPQQDVGRENWDGLAIRIEIFKTLDAIHVSFPRTLIPYLANFLNASLSHLRALYPTFLQYYLTSSAGSVPESSEDTPIELAHLICPIVDFASSVTRGGKTKDWYAQGNLNSLVGEVVRWMQMTTEDEESWATNANVFIAQEEDETQSYSIRVAAFDLLAVLIERMPAQTVATLHSTIQRVIGESRQARASGDQNWWRPLEAVFAALGSSAEAILDCIDDEVDSQRPKPIDIESLLLEVVPSFLGLSECPFLQGRGFVFASQYAKLLPVQLGGQYLDAAVQVIEAQEAGIPIKVSAIKAVHNFCQGMDDAVLIPYMPRVAKDIGPFLLVTSEDTLSLVLDTLSAVVETDRGRWLTPDLASSLVLATLEVWAKNSKDPLFISILTEILSSLASSAATGIYETIVQQALPTLCTSIGSAPQEEAWVANGAIELVTSIVEGAPEGRLGEGFFGTLAPSLFSCMKATEDRDIVQNGVVCLTLIIRKDCPQLLNWSDGQGQSGLENVLVVVAKVLESQDESGGLVIGDLIIHLLRRAGGAISPVLPEMLRAMVGRMGTAKTATFIQSLVIPFCFLLNSQRDTVLSLLESTEIQGRSGLDIFIQTLCENAETFQGFWPSRITNLALCQLYVSERPSLQNLVVKGDIIVRPETRNVIMTRSRTRKMPHEFTSIPFPAKALKLLLKDLQSGGEAAALNAGGENVDVESDDGDEEWTEEERMHQGFKADEFAFLSDMIGPRGAFDNDDILDDADDEDLKNDPVSQMDMRAHLIMFFKECAARNTSNFRTIVDQLSAEEIAVIRRVVNEN